MRSRGRSAAVTDQELDEMAEKGLRALRHATEKALRQPVVTLCDLEEATRRLETAGFHLAGAPLMPGVTLSEDPNLALASLRIELERHLRQTSEQAGGILELIYESGRFTEPQSSALVHLVTLLNSAVHGAAVTKDAPSWVENSGARIFAAIRQVRVASGAPPPPASA